MKMKVRIEGTDQIARNIRAMGKALTRETLMPILKEHVQPVADDMKAHAARASGEMADSTVVSERLSPRQQALRVPIAPVEVYAGPGPLPQAIAKEFGNIHTAPEPFIRPAFDAGVDRALKGIATDGIAAILAAAKKG
ncbi:HK97 gp10 family phage protein [Sphingomonas sp. Leaf4]|uniref:HK97 gp10 family phage protein n=1 Tax=Sphingomonas sp. Leaf4 TaxID=2876553 RepID=UPI001E42996C|nr:HK97 gp10 family phage protein [Sphingomonas sp. Leaf4]